MMSHALHTAWQVVSGAGVT